jgi:hypothetical protein
MSRTIWISILAGLLVQLIALAVIWSFGRERLIIGWGAGTLLRLAALLAYGWAIVPTLGLQRGLALLTLVGVLFVTTLVEPFLLNDGREKRGPT